MAFDAATSGPSATVESVDVLVIGTGFAGLGMAIKLKEAGMRDFVVLERDAGVAGTWRANHYPGCACDVQSHLYSFSFAPNPEWTRAFAPQPGELVAELPVGRHRVDAARVVLRAARRRLGLGRRREEGDEALGEGQGELAEEVLGRAGPVARGDQGVDHRVVVRRDDLRGKKSDSTSLQRECSARARSWRL